MTDEMKYANDMSELIKINTTTNLGDEAFNTFHRKLKELLPNVYDKCEINKVYEGNALLFKLKGKSDKKPIVLMGHQDVVPADDANWKFPPFSGTIADGRIWGRGAMDCKNTLYVSLKALDELIAEGYVPDNDVYIASSDNEETFGMGATSLKNYLKERGIKPYIVLDEGGAIIPAPFPGMTKAFAMVGVLEKGYGDIKFTARSKGGHSSSPSKDNPVARLSAFITDIETGHYFKKKMEPEVEQMLRAMSDGMTGAMKFLLKNVHFFKPLITALLPKISGYGNAIMSTTMVFTMTSASNASNVIPQEASAVANMRYIPHQDMDECLAILKDVAKKYDIEMKVMSAYKSLPPVSIKSDGYKLLEANIKKCRPEIGISPYLILGGTDARHFQDICDCVMRFTPMMLQPDQMAGMHGFNESIDIAEIKKGIDFMKEFIISNK